MKTQKIIIASFVALIGFSACDSNPVTDTHEHADVEGLALLVGGVEIVVVEDGQVTGQIDASAGQETAEILVEWRDHDGNHFHDEDLDERLTLGHKFMGDTDIAEFEQHSGTPRFSFHIHGVASGSTSMELQLFNVDHVDFRTPSIPILVQ